MKAGSFPAGRQNLSPWLLAILRTRPSGSRRDGPSAPSLCAGPWRAKTGTRPKPRRKPKMATTPHRSRLHANARREPNGESGAASRWPCSRRARREDTASRQESKVGAAEGRQEEGRRQAEAEADKRVAGDDARL